MDHFLYNQICCNCKKSSKTFKVFLRYYDHSGRFTLSEEEVISVFSFVCQFCNSMNIIDFEEIANPFTICYIRKDNEINRRIDEVCDNLLKIKIMKLKITT